MADRADLELYRGDDYAATVTVLNEDGTVPDITGYVPRAQIRLTPIDPVLVEMAAAVDPPNLIQLGADSAQVSLLQYEHYVWDLQVIATDSFGTPTTTTLLTGYVNVTPEVTR